VSEWLVDQIRKVFREVLREELTSKNPTVRKTLFEILREELMSGDAATKKIWAEIIREELMTGNKTKSKPAKTQSLVSIFDTSVTADTDIFTDITIEYDGVMRVMCAFDTAGILRAKITRAGVTKVLDYKEGGTLTANSIYAFDLPVKAGDLFNLRYSVAAIAHIIEVQFILWAI